MKRTILFAALLLVIYGWRSGASTVHSEAYPERYIQFIIPNVPGSTMDNIKQVMFEDNDEKNRD